MRRSLYLAGALALAAGTLSAQQRASVRAYSYDDRDRAALGITTSSGGMRDTLGLLVQSVTAGGPADKAGIEEGNRIASINGVNLRLSAADAGEGDMDNVLNRRLIRELEKVKAGDEVDLRVWAGGQTKSIKVKTVAFEDLPSRSRTARRELEDRPTVGMSLTATGSRRDTLGMMVVRVSTDGPAEKAGIIEGDRVQAINGVSLRVASEDAGDGYTSSARMNRYRRELSKVSVGEDVELRVLSGGQTKTVRLKPVRVGDLPRDRNGFTIIGDGAYGFGFGGDVWPLPAVTIPPVPVAPRAPRIYEFDSDFIDGVRLRIDPRARVEIQQRIDDAMRHADEVRREALERLRFEVERRSDGTVVTPAPRARAGSRIATTGSSGGSGYAYGAPDGQTNSSGVYSWTPAAQTVSSTSAPVAITPAVNTGSNVASWSGDETTFVLQGLRLARVNDDLAETLGRGSEQGFLVLDAGQRWSGLRAGDVLLEVDGHPVRDGNAARIALDDTVNHSAEVIREGRRRTISVDVR